MPSKQSGRGQSETPKLVLSHVIESGKRSSAMMIVNTKSITGGLSQARTNQRYK